MEMNLGVRLVALMVESLDARKVDYLDEPLVAMTVELKVYRMELMTEQWRDEPRVNHLVEWMDHRLVD